MLYKGWKNKETWIIASWSLTPHGTKFLLRRFWREGPFDTLTIKNLAEHMQSEFAEFIGGLPTGPWEDILYDVETKIDWRAIAEAVIARA